ncbi:hypothetical protein THAOC_14226, partial [Thalassiosira oceanica]
MYPHPTPNRARRAQIDHDIASMNRIASRTSRLHAAFLDICSMNISSVDRCENAAWILTLQQQTKYVTQLSR